MTMQKQIGFGRNIYRLWLDAAGDLCTLTGDTQIIRQKLDRVVEPQVASAHNRRMAVDILVNIWVKTGKYHPSLHQSALELYRQLTTDQERLWLHYGLTLLYYPFFRDATAIIGMLNQHRTGIPPGDINQRMIAQHGQLGALEKATERVVSSLRDWGLLVPTERRYVYHPLQHELTTPNIALQQWLLAAAIAANPAEELLFFDLMHLPELFPFHMTLSIDVLRHSPFFEVHRQGISFDMVRLS